MGGGCCHRALPAEMKDLEKMQSRGRMGTYPSGRERGGLGEKGCSGGSAVSVQIELEVSGACMRRRSSAMDCRHRAGSGGSFVSSWTHT